VITISDRVAAGTAEDRSGPALVRLLQDAGLDVIAEHLVPDEPDEITAILKDAAADLIVTTGGTGLAARDRTPQATLPVLDYEVPGLAEEMRRAGRASTPLAILSRGVAGVRRGALVINLPGSVNGATESLRAVLPAVGHALDQLAGETGH